MSIQLTPQQQAAVDNRGGELLVSAAAGSGKTRVLVERLLNRVEQEGRNVDEFLIITFTKAAASELRGKILQGLNQRLAEKPQDRHLRRQLSLVYRTQISTIHSFCTAILREFGYALDLDPDTRVAEENDAAMLCRETLERVLEQHYETMEDGFSNLVDTMSAGRDDSSLKSIILDIYSRVQAHPSPEQWLAQQGAAFDLSGVRDVGTTKWGGVIMNRARRQAEYWYSRLVQCINDMMEDPELEKAYSPSFCDTMDSLEDFIGALDRGWDSARALCEISFPRLGSSRKVSDKMLQERVKLTREQCKKRMKDLTKLFYADQETVISDLEQVRPAVQELFALVLELDEAFAQAKRRRRMMDFNDLEHLTLKMLLDGERKPTSVALTLRSRYAEVMVDEYQDTNAVQNAIFDAVTEDGKNLFQVGDVKQSIYRFRLADPTIFLRKYHSFSNASAAKEGQPRTVVLSQNFRSRASVLNGVNFIFEHIMSYDFGEMDYTEDQRLNVGYPYPEHPDDRVELDVVDLSEISGKNRDKKTVKIPKDKAEAEHVARRVRALLDEGFPVTEGDTLRPVRPEDIAILYRSPGAVMGYLTQALDRQNVPWQSEGAEDYFRTTEICCALAFLEVIDNPRQDIPLVSVLRSPVYGFTPDELAALRADCRHGDLYTCLTFGAEHGNQRAAAFLRELAELRLRSKDSSCADLLWHLYDTTGLLALFSAMSGGFRRREHLLALYEWAGSFGSQGRRSLFDFVSHLRQLREQDGKMPSIAKSSGSGVRIMSVHRSKGLEFPVVILAGLNRAMNREDEKAPMLFHPKLGVGPKGLDPELRLQYPTLARKAVQLKIEEESKAEELRLLYVAMTRAREKLIMTMSMEDMWRELSNLMPDAGPHPDPQSLQEKNSVASWLLLPVLARTDAAVLRPNVQNPNPISATDWDIRVIFATDHTDASEAPVQERETERETTALDLSLLDWEYPWKALADLPSKITATQLKGRVLDEESAEETRRPTPVPDFPSPRFEQEARGLTAARKGTVIHSVMEHIDPARASTEEEVMNCVREMVAGKWLTKEEGDSVNPAYVADFFRSDLGREAAKALDLRREFKFSLFVPADQVFPDVPEGEQVMLQGVIDCCFTGQEGMTIIDFKSDRVRPDQLAEHSERYRSQLESYSKAAEQIFGTKVTRRILWYFHAGAGCRLDGTGTEKN